MMRTKSLRWPFVAGLLMLFLMALVTGRAIAQSKSLYWERFDVDLTVNTDGTFDVREAQEIQFTQGSFTYGFRSIDTRLVESISDIRVEDEFGPYEESDSEEPRTFSVSQEGSSVVVRWYFEETADTAHTYVISYRVHGGLRYYDDGDQIWWQAVYGDRSFPVNSSVVTIHVPAPAKIQNMDSYFTSADMELVDDQTARLTATERIPAGQIFEVRAQFTPGVVAGSPSAWQAAEDARAAELEAQAEYEQQWKPVVDLFVGALSLMMLIMAPVALYLVWYIRGRDARTDFAAEYLPEPPSNLEPGMAGTLLDEKADMEDILATLVDLGRRGYVRMEELEPEKTGIFGRGQSDFKYKLLKPAKDKSLRRYERLLLSSVFGSHKERKLSDLKEKFYKHLSKIQKALYKEVVDEGFFTANPEKTRSLWAIAGVVMLILTFVFMCVSGGLLANYTDFTICVPLGPGLFAIGLIVLARFMPRKTAKGAEEAARWEAFRTYLEDIDKYTDLERATELFDRYLPYAIAFGLEKDYLKKWSKVKAAPTPPWFMPYPRPYYNGHGAPSGGHMAAPAPRPAEGGGSGVPTLSDASSSMSAGLAGMSAGLTTMLSSASSTLRSKPQPSGGSGSGGWSGGGWSGGGSFGGGGGGGGGGGFG
ncbi:MAG TPA: DUF2207 domain-containing protein [Caldilineae bacterium]|nr:DUF2207 domain-containing protein [Caldilineae bacterium]